MTNKQLKNLKDRVWEGADQLHANSGLKSTEYATPILGLIFLRFAESKYGQYEAEILAEFEKNQGTRTERPIHEIAVEKCGYYLPPEARFEYLLNLPEAEDLALATKLYEGRTDEFSALIDEYRAVLAAAPETSDDEDAPPKIYWQEQIDWLTERFPNGVYTDVIGLCKAAKLDGEDGIIDQDYSLNPGRYVGVVIEDDGMTEEEFKVEMLRINAELTNLNDEAHTLERTVAENLRSLVSE
jgi:type I restriction-modification system DNA methylase subunit